MKKILSYFLALILIINCGPIAVYAQDTAESKNTVGDKDSQIFVQNEDVRNNEGQNDSESTEPSGDGDVNIDEDVRNNEGQNSSEIAEPSRDGDIVINETNFPDEVFRKYLKEHVTGGDDGVFTADEIANVKEIDLLTWRIHDIL